MKRENQNELSVILKTLIAAFNTQKKKSNKKKGLWQYSRISSKPLLAYKGELELQGTPDIRILKLKIWRYASVGRKLYFN